MVAGDARRFLPSVLAFAVVGLLGGLSIPGCTDGAPARQQAATLPHVRAARVELVAPRPSSRHLVPLEPLRRARLAPRAGGEVIALDADEEQRVREGDVLVRFAGADPRGGLISARASIERIEENLRDAERELVTARELAVKGAGTTRDVERAQTHKIALEAQLREARGQLVRARDRVGATAIVAPFEGTVTSVQTELGEYLGAGSPALVLAQLDPIAVRVPLTQREVERFDRGGLTFRVHARGESIEPTLEWMASEADPESSTFAARLQVPNPEYALRAGELVDVEVFGAAQPKVKAVPATAIRWAADQAYVLRIDEAKLAKVEVEVRDDTDDLVVIEGDIETGAHVVSSGPIALLPGDEVRVVEPPEEALAAR